NLLPSEIRMDRIIRAKKPYGVAAAAMLLLGTAGLAWGFGEELKSVKDKKIADAEKQMKAALGAYGTRETAITTKVAESLEEQKKGKMIIAGQEERLNWPRFFE